MGRAPAKQRRAQTGRTIRPGRPPRELAGEVDERILAAARRVFLERGLVGASMDEIASLASAGKPTIYARYPGKEALFKAVGLRNVAAAIARFESHVPSGATIEERLASVGETLLHWALVDDTIDLMRVAIAEARRFPDLAASVHRMGRERGKEAVARLLGEAAQSDDLGRLPPFAPDRLVTTAQFFLELVLLPLLLRALFGEKLKPLRAEIVPHVARSVAFFLAACKQGSVEG